MSNLRQAKMECENGREPMLLGVKASGAVKGRLLLMTLEQRYRNTSSNNAEITYTFPLPQGPNGGAVLMDVEVDINGNVLKGEVSVKTTARAKYEEAISEGNTGILLERNYDGSFTLELGNLMAGEECKIMIRYAQTLAPEHGQIRMMLPTTIAPRYGNPITQGRLQPHQVPVTDTLAEYPFDITVVLFDDMAYSNVSSPSHKTSYYRNGNDLVIKLAQQGYLDKDFVLIFSNLKSESVALTSKDFYQEGQHAMMASFCPKFEASGNSKALNAKILVDCSSSMSGDSIDAARKALVGFVQGITKEDKFSLSRFGEAVEHRSRGMWSGTGQAKVSAMRWIEGVHANMGGTEMASALVSTVSISDNGKGDILLITDGEIEGIDEVIDVATNSKHRIFVVAIGSSPAEGHLRRLATATGGYCDFVAPGEKVEPAILRMFGRMRAPRIKNLRVKWPNALRTRWEQNVQSYAFEDDVLHVCAFVDTPEDLKDFTSVKLWGQVDDSENDVLMGVATLAHTESSTNIVARMTANARYSELYGDGSRAKNVANAGERLDLAVTYRLITEETNFILVHERADADKATEMPDSHKVPQMLPGGWGGTGSVVRSSVSPMLRVLRSGTDDVLFNLPAASSIAALNSLCAPSAWRANRTQAAARVDALSSSGMDDFDIPAFLRKRADADDQVQPNLNSRNSIDKTNPLYWKTISQSVGKQSGAQHGAIYVGITPAGLAKWLSVNHNSLWPSTYADLRDLGVGLSICEWLEFEIGLDRDEQLVVATFLNAVREFRFAGESTLARAAQAAKGAMSIVKVEKPETKMASEIRLAMASVGPQIWPLAVINFPEECC